MSGNTLSHHAGQNLPAIRINITKYFSDLDYNYWQAQADNAAVCAREQEERADDAWLEGNWELANSLLAITDELTLTARDLEDRADDSLIPPKREFTPPYHLRFFVTDKGKQLQSLLSHDTTGIAAQGITLFVGEDELTRTLHELLACQHGEFTQIRPVTIHRGLISYSVKISEDSA